MVRESLQGSKKCPLFKAVQCHWSIQLEELDADAGRQKLPLVIACSLAVA
jgi:hypothetical protein